VKPAGANAATGLGILGGILLVGASMVYLVVLVDDRFLARMINGTANRATQLLWFSLLVPLFVGFLTLVLHLFRRRATAAFATVLLLLALVVAGLQFAFGAPSDLYIAGGVAVVAAVVALLAGVAGIVLYARNP